MSVEIQTINKCSDHKSPKPISLPPLSSIFNSPPPPTPNFLQTPQQKLPFGSISSTPLFTQSQSHNQNHNHSLSQHPHEKNRAARAISLPSIDNLTNSPSFKRSTSLNSLPLPTPSKFSHFHHMNNSNDNIQLNKSFINSTPIAHNLPPPPPIFQSTPAENLNLNHSVNINLSPSFNNKLQQKLEESKNSINLTPNHSVLKKRKKSFDTPDENKKFAFISHSQATFLSSEPDIDNARLARRKRRRTSPSELAVLQSEFEKGSTPNKQRRISIAIKVDMTEKAIQIWFQNKRQALRKNQNHNVKEILLDMPKQDDTSEIDPLHNNSKSNTDDDEDTTSTNLENSPISSPISQKSISNSFETKQLPPTGVFMTLNNNESNRSSNSSSSSISSASSFLSTNNDTVNTSTGGQTFKFKSTDFGLVIPTSSTTRRQKPTMKLNLKNKNNNNNNSNILRNKTNIKNINNINNNLKDFKTKLIPSKFGAPGKENRIPIKTEN